MRKQRAKTKRKLFGNVKRPTFSNKTRKSKPYAKGIGKDRRTRFVGLAIKITGMLIILLVVSTVIYFLYITQKYKKFETFRDIGDIESVESPSEINNFYLILNINRNLDSDHSFIELSYFLKIDYTNQTINLLSIPTEYYTWDFSAKSYEKVKNLRNLGAEKEPRQDTTYSQNAINEMLGMRADYYLNINTDTLSDLINEVGGVNVSVDNRAYEVSDYDRLQKLIQVNDPNQIGAVSAVFMENFLGKIGQKQAFIQESWVYKVGTTSRTNLVNPEIFRLVNLLSSQKLTFNISYLDETSLREEDKISPPIEVFDQDRVDFVMRKQFEDINIKKEQARFEIYNGTTERLLATYWGRVFKNSSLDVIRVGTVKEVDRTEIYVPGNDQNYSDSLKEIKRLLQVNPVIINDRPSSVTTTGDVIVVLGKDVLE